MKITRISVKKPLTTFMFFIAIVLLGLISLREMSVDLLPDLRYPRLSVFTQYPGVAPEEIETFLTRPLEAAVLRIPGLRRVESVSREGVSSLTIEFAWGTDMDFALLHTREKLDSVMLPDDVEEPIIIPLDPQSKPFMIISVSGERSLLELKEFSEELLKPRLEQIDGVGSAEIAGGIEREILVEINPERLSLYGLSIGEISSQIHAFNHNLQGGAIQIGRFKYSLRIVGEYESPSEIGEISLKSGGEKRNVELKDVAWIKDSVKERSGITRLNGKESIGILIRGESGANTVKVAGLVHDVLHELEEQYPQIDFFIVKDQAEFIKNAISSVVHSVAFGGILAFLILVFFLQDFKTPLIIAAVIPISVLATFNFLYFRHITLNIMSLGGLALGIGMLVDNSIVVSESIFRHRAQGRYVREAAVSGTREVGMAVTASTFTTISVFLPVVYVHGVAGQLFKDQALAVTFSLLSSLIVSLTLLPVLAVQKFRLSGKREKAIIQFEDDNNIQRRRIKQGSLLELSQNIKKIFCFAFKRLTAPLVFVLNFIIQIFLLMAHSLAIPTKLFLREAFKGFNFAYQRFAARYHHFLIWSLENKGKVFAGSAVFLVLTLLIAGQIPRELLPKPETTTFELNLKTPEGYSLEQTADLVFSIEKWLKSHGSNTVFFSQIGIIGGMEVLDPEISLNSAKIFVDVREALNAERLIEDLRKRLKEFSGINYSIIKEQSTLAQFLTFPTSEIRLKIKGENLDTLEELAEKAVKKLNKIEEIVDVKTSIIERKPEILIKINKKSLERYDISPAQVGSFLVDLIRGKKASQLKEMDKKYDILVRLEERERKNIASLLDERILCQGTQIPLREFVDVEMSLGPREIRRENQQREILITASMKGAKISRIVPRIKQKIEEISLPLNFRIDLGGEQEEMTKSFRSLIFAFCMAVLLVYMIMAAQFESLFHPFLILLTLPMGITGALWALFLTGQTLNVISVIGMVVLAGIIVNDAIVKVDYINQLRKEGYEVRIAIIEASQIRLRPILMTTITTAFGLLPMSLGIGKGSELQQPLAITIIGGVVLATFLTLILIPLFYDVAEKKKS